MFKLTRKRITAVFTAGMLIFVCIILAAVYIQSWADTERRNGDDLERYVRNYRLDGQSDQQSSAPPEAAGVGKENHGEKDPGFAASAFYSVAFAPDGTVLRIDNTDGAYMSDDELAELARETLASGGTEGKSSLLMWKVAEKDGFTLVAFLNISNSRTVLNSLQRVIVYTAAASLIVLPFAAYWAAGAIVRPLEENDRRQKQFISDAGHELKTPIAVISTNAELLSREGTKSEWLDNIRYENDRMGKLVREMLDLSRAESTGPVMEQLDLSRLAEGEALPFESVAFENGHELVCDIEKDISVRGDRLRLCQAVSILLDNAVQHSLPGGRIELSLKKEHHSAVLRVSNPAQEISREAMENLFERFYRADGSRTGDGKNYGLGLAIAKAIAQAHQGTIEASFEDGIMTFTFSVPVR
ncbi:MAG: HAMP domain-containing histidine kinase [Eubacteriales bacterium]|nr:HAMP domain-containing histidine kinase [Eubacteriales bacterium]